MKAYHALAVANEFIELANNEKSDITPLKLQKLVYICHGRRLGIQKFPLILERVQAWKYGPVIPEIYHEFKDYGRSKITQKATKLIDIDINTGDFIEHVPTIDTEEEKNFVKLVWDKYKKYTGIQLSNSTHVNDTPWDKARSKDQNIISDLDIQEYYEGLMKND